MTFFPDRVHADAGEYAKRYFELISRAADAVDLSAMAAAGALLSETARAGGTIYSCGNGGSAAIANHLVCDCLKGVRTGSTLKPRVFSLSTTVELITAIVNDIGSDEMFAFQLNSLGRSGDVLIAISSSGASPNIIRALNDAKSLGISTIAMTGFGGGQSAKLADINLHVDAQNYGLVEDVHQSMMHILAQYMRHAHFTAPDTLGSVKF
jgi:D-sedoheptulose 7-phosphate isomerase